MQQEENYLAQSISQVDADARYDEGVKRLLANKSILAVIMKECVPEYRGCMVREIAEKYIEGEPQIGAVGVDADETNRNISATIHGANTEDVTLTEGTIRYDVRFYATAPSEDGLAGARLVPYKTSERVIEDADLFDQVFPHPTVAVDPSGEWIVCDPDGRLPDK